MRAAKQLLILVVIAAATGCETKPRIDPRPFSSVEIDGLLVSMNVPGQSFAVGDTLAVTVTAHNTTGQPMRILSTSGAPVYVHLSRHTGLTWQRIKRYPQTATMLMTPWTLERKSQRVFALQLTVAPDWPAAEPLHLTAELNGRPGLSPGIIVEVVPRSRRND